MAAVSRTCLHEVSKVVDFSVGAGFDPHPELSHFQSLDMDDMDRTLKPHTKHVISRDTVCIPPLDPLFATYVVLLHICWVPLRGQKDVFCFGCWKQ